MKEKLTNNLSVKILSLFIAALTWVIIVNVADPTDNKTFTGVEVEVINQSAFSSINKVYEVIDGSTVDIKVKGKKSVVDSLTKKDFRAVADLSAVSPMVNML